MYFLIISGMSGAGKSRAVASMEDLGFYCVDNLPIALIPTFAEVCLNAADRYEKVALCTDVRAGGNFDQLFTSLEAIKKMGCEVQILFLDTDTSKLINRYKETRRKHPLMEEGISMPAAIEKERTLLEGIRGKADYVVDTTRLSVTDLREKLISIFGSNKRDGLFEVHVTSFGFKYGIPPEADLVFDVRFLPNPYYEISLREHNGTEKNVRDYVFQDGLADQLMVHLNGLMDFLLPRYVAEGKTSITVAVGCTGGKHRSVAIAEAVAAHIQENEYTVNKLHRDYQR